MPSGFRFNWKGKEIEDRVAKASRQGIDVVLARCVPEAKRSPPLPVITGTAQGSIQMRPARAEGILGRRIVGIWGSFDVNYFIWLEIGARGRTGGFMLRRAADRFYPTLGGTIARFFKA